ncbi:glycosyltransferase [Variovorax sp. ZS18.2.2]|uniref:glycosyltransferase family 2 protein n=1 Tax=Variovorax sp. ZS18.2.2 TaxID=2971255 RepID=UPI002150993B|nr:glycosyltransferase [Variovorax sp. ZS18.2.2]MCR6476971.1 glycosyltransferase [Variovorax sp. ZS18.2.2]
MTLEISALLTTRNRAHLLPMVLAALARQTLDQNRFEVIAIDDGSTDTTPQVLDAWKDRLPLRIVRPNHAGLAAAKNLGVFMARAPLVVFLDDDDVADPDLLTAHLAAHIANPDLAVAILGRTRLAPEVAASPLMHHVTEVGCQLFSYGWMKPGQQLSHTEFWGGRSSCKRELLVQHGVFRPEFHFGCEDIELGWRLAARGLRVIYEPRALTTMIRSLSLEQFCDRSYRQGLSQRVFASFYDDPKVHAYCEIDAAKDGWAQGRTRYAAHLRWTRQLEHLVVTRKAAGMSIAPLLRETLDQAYREAFFLSRAKGIVDMSKRMASSLPLPAVASYRSIFEFGLPSVPVSA